ncbi:hypothetical protein [Salinispora pacifica]|uniref:hypothetical protein n=1 Tax=Salinispora pacifica TaxID=351187 RepID=UPI0012BBD590|nr:hypothetical protein [Salinispora pacifica]
MMPAAGEWRHIFRASIDSGGGLVDIARIIRSHGESGQYIQAAAALRQEFGFKIVEALAVVGWAEGSDDSEVSLLEMCRKIETEIK